MEYKNDFDNTTGTGQENPYDQGSPYNQGTPYNQDTSYNQGTPYNQGGPYNQGSNYGGSQIIVGEQEPEQKNSTFAVVSLVLGILGIVFVCCVFYLSFILGIIGLVLGIISLVQNRDGKGLAIAGTILNGLTILISVLILILYAAFGYALGDLADYTSYEEAPYEYQIPAENPADGIMPL